VAFAGGSPLALSLGASVLATGAPWEPTGEVLTTLVERLVGDLPGPAHRRALEVVAQAYVTRESLLRAVLGDEDARRKKPEPELVLKLAESAGVSPARVLVVGDTTYDIEMGHAAGAQTCAVTYGSHDRERLARVRPTYQLDSLAGLGALLGP